MGKKKISWLNSHAALSAFFFFLGQPATLQPNLMAVVQACQEGLHTSIILDPLDRIPVSHMSMNERYWGH
jgi:hypothetical protein